MKKARNLKEKVILKIYLKNDNVFLRDDFSDLGGYDQVGRALKELVRANKSLKIGYGLYSKAQISTISGKLVPEISLPRLASVN